VTETLVELWSEVMPVKAQLASREINTGHAALVAADEPVAVTRLSVAFGQRQPCRIDILTRSPALRAIEGQLSAKVHDDTGMSGAEWRERMGEALADVRLQARSVLARPTLSVSELLQLKAGDVIPISLPALVPLLVAGRQDRARQDRRTGRPRGAANREDRGGTFEVNASETTIEVTPIEVGARNYRMLADIPLRVSVEVGSTSMKLSELLDLAEGSVVELDRQAHELLDIMVNGTLVARGEVVTVNGRFGIRVVDVIAADARLAGIERRI
jgi:flagellar motor switch protein FliN